MIAQSGSRKIPACLTAFLPAIGTHEIQELHISGIFYLTKYKNIRIFEYASFACLDWCHGTAQKDRSQDKIHNPAGDFCRYDCLLQGGNMISITERARRKLEDIQNSLPEEHSPIWDIVFMGFG